jgi:ATP-dependent helicase/nuclease subunit A
VLVTAGAGAGKTRTLVARYLAILADGVPLRSVVAITFTRKAAREMRNRIRRQIQEYLVAADRTPAERAHWEQLYGALDGARIGTIHSLCGEILRFHPAQADVDPNFDLLDEGVSAVLRGQAVEEALIWAAEISELLPLFSVLGQWTLQSTLAQLLADRLSATAAFETVTDSTPQQWQAAIQQQRQTTLEEMEATDSWRLAVDTLRNNRATSETDRMEYQRVEVLAAIGAPAQTTAERVEHLNRLGQINRQGGSAKAWPGGKAQLAEVKEALRTLRSAWDANYKVLQLACGEQDDQLARLLPLLRQLFSTAVEKYRAMKAQRNSLDYDDLEKKTLQLLTTYPPARDYWQSVIDTIMVDEFQDTNQRQAELIQHLKGQTTRLFLVGDAKQSIYRFRGADVSVFRRKESQAKNVCRLETSYRAHRDLVVTLNNLFRPVLGEPAPNTPDYVEPFSRLIPWREAPAQGVTSPYIELHLAIGSKSSGALDRAAAGLALHLRQLLADTDLTPADIAILCRSSTSFAAYENALEAAGLPFLTVAGRGFYHRAEVRDVLNALQALTDPTDDLALAGMLRSPVFGVSDAGLYWLTTLCHQPEQSLWAVIGDLPAENNLSEQDIQQVQAAATLINSLRHTAGRTTIADLLKSFLDSTNYRAALIRAGQQRAARNLSKLLADAHDSGLVHANDFLEYVNGLRDSGTREGEARAIAEGVITIMSVHAAKGLEFPLVVIGDITHSGRGGSGPIIDSRLGPILPLKDSEGNLPAVYGLAHHQEASQEDAETRRLLYVAATRAREKLILNGTVSVNRKGALNRLGEWLGLLAAPLGVDSITVDLSPEANLAQSLDLPAGHLTLYEPDWIPPVPAPHSAPVQPVEIPDAASLPDEAMLAPLPGTEEVAPASDTLPERVFRVIPATARSAAPTWVVGSLVHEALALWRFPDASFPDWAGRRARTYGLTDTFQLKDAGHRCQQLLTRFQADPLFREIDTADRRLHEVPFSLMIDDRPENGRIDCLFQTGERWSLVDFKVDYVFNEAQLIELLRQQDYLPKLESYRRAVTTLTGQPPTALLCFLDYHHQIRSFDLETLQRLLADQPPSPGSR